MKETHQSKNNDQIKELDKGFMEKTCYKTILLLTNGDQSDSDI